jgi:hypothetical protein
VLAWPGDQPTTSARRPVALHTAAETKYPRKQRASHHQSCTRGRAACAMAAVTSSTASLCPAAGLPSSSSPSSSFRRKSSSSSNHGRRLQTAIACHCRPARSTTLLEGGVGRREAVFGILLSAVAAPALAPAGAPADEGTGTAGSMLSRSCPPPAVCKCVLVRSCVPAKRCLFLQSCPLIRVAGGLHHVRG